MKIRSLTFLSLVGTLFAHATDIENPTSNNREIQVLPAPGKVVVDGLDNDWDLSAGIWSYNNPTLVDRYSVWTHTMWDEKGVYLLMRYTDRSPKKNATRGKDFHKSWQADAFQGRLVLDGNTPDEHQMHINGFYSSTEDKSYLLVNHGGLKKTPPYDNTGPFRQDQFEKWGDTMTAAGGEIAFKEWEDGKGYNLEAFLPWSYLRTNGKPLAVGDRFQFGIEAMWGSADGTRVEHRLVDNLRNDEVNRIFFFRAKDGWGDAVIAGKGDLKITADQIATQQARLKQFVNYDTVGSIPLVYDLAKDGDVTIAIDNDKGQRVRNLFGQYPRKAGKNTDYWDGLDDAGNPVPPGKYQVIIVDHEPLSLKRVNSVYNSATPPWTTDNGTQIWGSNHGNPTTAATRGDVILLGFTGTEGSSGMMRVSPEGRIKWTDGTELLDITLDDKLAYSISREGWTKRVMVRRLNLETGALVLFENPEKSTETVLPIDYKTVTDASIAYAYGNLYVAVSGNGLWQVNPVTGAFQRLEDLADLRSIENYNDQLYALFTDGRVARLKADGKMDAPLFTATNLTKPARLAISQDGKRFAISDPATNQVFLYDPQGKLIETLGQPYAAIKDNRPAGKFVETDLIRPLGLAFDAQGRLWVAEAAHDCRRVTTWAPDGSLVQQFWGSADYGAMFGYAFTFDSNRFIVHGIEFELDPNPDPMNRPTQEKPVRFHPDLAKGSRGVVYRYQGHEYALNGPNSKMDGFTIAQRGADQVFRKVISVTYDNPRTKDKDESRAWVDRNENGIEDEGEVVSGVAGNSHYWVNAWMGSDLTVVTPDQNLYRPQGFTKGGVPLYDFQKPEKPANKVVARSLGDHAGGTVGAMVIDKAGNLSDGTNYATVDGRSGSYPNPFKRHDAPAARRGLLIAPFRTNGVVEDVPGVGSITAIGGDRGEWFLLSMDGIYLSSILQDSKGDVTLDDTFVGQESFGGFIWRDEKGRVLVQLGGPSFRIMEVLGLDTTRKQTLSVEATPKLIEEGAAIALKNRGEQAKEPEKLMVAKVPRLPREPAPVSTGPKQTLIAGAETVRIVESGDPSKSFRVALAQDGKSLAVAWLVNDSSAWKNAEGRFSHGFIGGDSVDLQLDIPGRGPVRILGAPLGGQNSVTYWQKKSATPENPLTYVVSNNEANAQNFDVVKRLESAKLAVTADAGKYSALLTIPLSDLGLDPAKVNELKGVVGVIFSDAAGRNRAARLYWHDKQTGLVSDVPSEASLTPQRWGTIEFGK